MTKIETLKQAQQNRISEIEHYQINIDNYNNALQILSEKQDEDLREFEAQIKELLRTSLIEQKKAQIMLDAISQQMGE